MGGPMRGDLSVAPVQAVSIGLSQGVRGETGGGREKEENTS